MSANIIILGASVRAAAQSALRAGLTPWCADLFADRDLRAIAPVRRCPRETYPQGFLDLLDDAPHAPVLYTGALENHPNLLAAIDTRRPLIGCDPVAVRRVRDPLAFASLDPIPGLRTCAVRHPRRLADRLQLALHCSVAPAKYLAKPLASGGGTRVRPATPWAALDRQSFLQQRAPARGIPLGVIYSAQTDGAAALLGATRQIIGDPALGARGYRYAGSIGPFPLDAQPRNILTQLGHALATRFNLRGLFGVDAILDDQGQIWPVEINPRYTASVEILERALGIAALSSLLPLPSGEGRGEGCVSTRQQSADPPRSPLLPLPLGEGRGEGCVSTRHPISAAVDRHNLSPIHAKAILFARADTAVPDLYEIFPPDQVADVPDPGEHTLKGQPICTLFARGRDADDCLARLHEMARRLYTRLRQ